MGQHLDKSARGAYDAIVYIDGSEVVAEDADGRKIASGVAGTNDVTVIQAAATLGGIVRLNGTFTRSTGTNYISPATNTEIIGFGIYNTSLENIRFRISNENVRIANLKIKGTTGTDAAIWTSKSKTICEDIYIDTWDGEAGLTIYANTTTISDCIFKNITIYRPSAFGVYNAGEGSPKAASRIRYENVVVYDAGVYNNSNNWATGFDTAENFDISDFELINCKVYGAWESCFHTDNVGTTSNLRYYGCYARDAGQKPVPTYGSGFLVPGGTLEQNMLFDCVSENCAIAGFNTTNNVANGTVLNNCIDRGSKWGFRVTGTTGRIILDNCISDTPDECGINTSTAANLTVKNLVVLAPGGDTNGYANWLGSTSYPISNSNINIHVIGGARMSIVAQSMSNSIISGSVYQPGIAGTDNALRLVAPTKVLVDGFEINVDGDTGIYCYDTVSSLIRNVVFQNKTSGTLTNGIIYGGTGNPTVSKKTIRNMGIVMNLFTGCIYDDENSGSSTGTGSEQTIAHGLAAIPTGCKAWIKYLVGTRYITEMVPFDATNIYPTVETGVAYEWRIE